MLKNLLILLWLLVAAASLSAATLVWDNNTESDLAGYNVYTTVGATQTTNTVTTNSFPISTALVPPGASATFFVAAFNAAGFESFPSSNLVYLRLGLPTPPVVTANTWSKHASDPLTYVIAWKASPAAENVTSYSVLFERFDLTPSVFATSVVTTTNLTGTVPYGQYRWTVSAVNASGISPASAAFLSPNYPGHPNGLGIK